MKETTNRYGVAAVDRAASILDALDGKSKVTLASIARATGLSEATVLRYLGSLVRHGFVERDEESGQYRLGMRLFQLGLRARQEYPVSRVARPWMERIHEEFRETVNLAARYQDRIIIIEAIEGMRSIRKGANVGEQDIWHASSLGKAILAHLPEAEARGILERGAPTRYTPKTLVTLPELMLELEHIRARGYALDDEESEEGQRCVGAPIFDHRGKPSYAISVSGPSSRISPEVVEDVARAVRTTAAAISAELGYLAETRAAVG